MQEETQSWHLDKRVPVALIIALTGQVVAVVWLAAVMFKDIESNRDGLRSLGGRVEAVERSAGAQAVQLGRIEESIRGMRTDIGRLLDILEKGYRR